MEHIEADGVVLEGSHSMFKVQIPDFEGSPVVICTIGGKLRKYKIDILPADHVRVKISPYDLSRGFIVYRYNSKKKQS
jgi:translation initiation factor IF-1